MVPITRPTRLTAGLAGQGLFAFRVAAENQLQAGQNRERAKNPDQGVALQGIGDHRAQHGSDHQAGGQGADQGPADGAAPVVRHDRAQRRHQHGRQGGGYGQVDGPGRSRAVAQEQQGQGWDHDEAAADPQKTGQVTCDDADDGEFKIHDPMLPGGCPPGRLRLSLIRLPASRRGHILDVVNALHFSLPVSGGTSLRQDNPISVTPRV